MPVDLIHRLKKVIESDPRIGARLLQCQIALRIGLDAELAENQSRTRDGGEEIGYFRVGIEFHDCNPLPIYFSFASKTGASPKRNIKSGKLASHLL